MVQFEAALLPVRAIYFEKQGLWNSSYFAGPSHKPNGNSLPDSEPLMRANWQDKEPVFFL